MQADRGRLEGQVRQLTAALAAAAEQQSQLAAHDKQRSKDASALQALADELKGKAAVVQEAQSPAEAAVGIARQLSATVDELGQQLQAARKQEAAAAEQQQAQEQRVAAEAAARAELQAQVVRLQDAVAQHVQSQAALQQQLEVASGEAVQLRVQLEGQGSGSTELEQQVDTLQQRAAAAEAEAATAAGQLVAACEQNAAMAEQLAQLQEQVRAGNGIVGRLPSPY